MTKLIQPRVLAAVAHPDDIEFLMAGTLLLLKSAGAELHFWNLAGGSLGSKRLGRSKIAATRKSEARAAARLAGAKIHAPLFDDLAIFYDRPSLARVAAVVRRVRPTIILTHALADYMEDHQNTARLVTTAAFSRAMSNYVSQPPEPSYDETVTLYHALPHGLRGPLDERPRPTHYVDIATVIETKRLMLACHQSQGQWLSVSQRMDAYLDAMEQGARQTGSMSERFDLAEGFVQHSSVGFCAPGDDPLMELLGPSGRCVR